MCQAAIANYMESFHLLIMLENLLWCETLVHITEYELD